MCLWSYIVFLNQMKILQSHAYSTIFSYLRIVCSVWTLFNGSIIMFIVCLHYTHWDFPMTWFDCIFDYIFSRPFYFQCELNFNALSTSFMDWLYRDMDGIIIQFIFTIRLYHHIECADWLFTWIRTVSNHQM